MKLISSLLILLSLALGVFTPYFQSEVAYRSPTAPNYAAGQINEYNMHGRVVYLKRNEYLAVTWMFNVALLIGGIGGVIWVIDEKWRKQIQETRD